MASKDVADILLIGSGASGGPFAWYLSQVNIEDIVTLANHASASKAA